MSKTAKNFNKSVLSKFNLLEAFQRPYAAGGRRVLNGSKLRKGSVMNSFKTPVLVLLYVSLYFTTKQ